MRWWPLALLIVVAVGLGACAKTQARVLPDRPPLDVPPVPPRVIDPLPATAAEESAPDTKAPREPATAPPAGRRAPSRPARSEPPPVEPAKPEAAPASRPGESRQLRTPQTADEAEAARRVRETIQRATGALDVVKYSTLSSDGQSQYDMAKRFVQQAEEALKARNFVFATYLATKAETLARELSRR